jgi:predicted GNAT family acetyltransferase
MNVRHNEAQHQYEYDAPHGLAVVVYHRQGDKLVFTHSEVPAADEGRGIGARLVKAALADANKRGFGVIPACSFVAAVMRRNPEFR